ncbi:unnamed protein product, partial [Symbiodinium pilosum]
FIWLPGFLTFLSLPGIIGGCLAMNRSPSVQARVSTLATLSAGPLYLSVSFMRFMLVMMGANLNTARRETGVNIPDQHVYKVIGGVADGAMVLMDDSEPFGRFNRAQRAFQNHFEQVFPFVLEFIMSGYVFPYTTAGCASAWAALRCYGSLSYANERMSRLQGNVLAGVMSGALSGLVLVTGVYATK